jgi:hypothetical protein
MIHSICDFCGKDMDRTGILLSLTPFQNFARYHADTSPYGSVDETRSFVICSECLKKHGLPNPYETYSGITAQEVKYEKTLDNYTDKDLLLDADHDQAGRTHGEDGKG